MAQIYLEKVNEVRMRVCSQNLSVYEEMNDYFKMPDPNFTPSNFSRYDGMLRFFQRSTGLIDIGLIFQVFEFCKKHKYTLEVDPRLKFIQKTPKEEVQEFVDDLNLSRMEEDGSYSAAEAREYQFDSVYTAIRDTRCVLQAATSAGKSLILYILARYYRMRREAIQSNLKTLIIVPSVHLVRQLYENFEEYSHFNGWNTSANVHQIYGDADKDSPKPVFISTWQGIQKMPKAWYHQFGDVVVDEVHTAAADKLSFILNNCLNCDQRVGVTGTPGNNQANVMRVVSHFGRLHNIISARELIEQGYAADIKIEMLELVYPQAERGLLTGDYPDEIEFLMAHKKRNELILTLARGLKGNVAIMFARIDAHMMPIYEALKKEKENVYVINGEIPAKERMEIQKAMERGEDITLLASFGTMQQGVSIKKLHHLVFAHPNKSYIRVIQTLGRLMRLHSSKDCGTIWDLVDNLKMPKYTNHSLRHSFERYRYYHQERHPIKTRKIQM